MKNFDRYGAVMLQGSKIQSFHEKDHYNEGLINGGIYIIDRELFLSRALPEKFSFETDYLEKYVSERKFSGSIQSGYFIDIGIPEDYSRAQEELKQPVPDLKSINREWTVFLDRDGVINEERVGEYVLNPDEFVFTAGAENAIRILSRRFGKVIVVSNQRGVGKKLMTENDLHQIHQKMLAAVEQAGGKIDQIYYCTEVSDRHFYRKPNPGLAVQALRDFPDIKPGKSVMVGNKPGDMRFGRSAGFYTVFIQSTNPDQPFPHPDIDFIFPSLLHFARAMELG
jgi:D-glycero-alpha-D-manno-heptose 1-phosphate guanylyltransferase